MLITNRRKFIIGAASTLAAPAIVRAEILMPVRKIILPEPSLLVPRNWGNPIAGFDFYEGKMEIVDGLGNPIFVTWERGRL